MFRVHKDNFSSVNRKTIWLLSLCHYRHSKRFHTFVTYLSENLFDEATIFFCVQVRNFYPLMKPHWRRFNKRLFQNTEKTLIRVCLSCSGKIANQINGNNNHKQNAEVYMKIKFFPYRLIWDIVKWVICLICYGMKLLSILDYKNSYLFNEYSAREVRFFPWHSHLRFDSVELCI